MAFSDFTLESAIGLLGVSTSKIDLFPRLTRAAAPDWLAPQLARGANLAFLNEKSRSEFIVAPILLAAQELSGERFAIFSGQRLDVDKDRGLVGECDFILALGPSVVPLRAPIAAIVEAKKNDVEGGLGQCVAQMVAARQFNEAAGRRAAPTYGCVTTGEVWQFLRLADATSVELHDSRLYLDNLPGVLGALLDLVAQTDQFPASRGR